jgi:hypothetical protein
MTQKKEFLPLMLEKLTKKEKTSEFKILKLLTLLTNNDHLTYNMMCLLKYI